MLTLNAPLSKKNQPESLPPSSSKAEGSIGTLPGVGARQSLTQGGIPLSGDKIISIGSAMRAAVLSSAVAGLTMGCKDNRKFVDLSRETIAPGDQIVVSSRNFLDAASCHDGNALCISNILCVTRHLGLRYGPPLHEKVVEAPPHIYVTGSLLQHQISGDGTHTYSLEGFYIRSKISLAPDAADYARVKIEFVQGSSSSQGTPVYIDFNHGGLVGKTGMTAFVRSISLRQ